MNLLPVLQVYLGVKTCEVFLCFLATIFLGSIQGSHAPWKSLKVLEFQNKNSRPWKSLKIAVGAGKSLNFGANFIQ